MADDYKPTSPSVWDILNKLKTKTPLPGQQQGIPTPSVIGPAYSKSIWNKPQIKETEKLPWSAPQVDLLGSFGPPIPGGKVYPDKAGPQFTTKDVINMLKEEGAEVRGKYTARGGTDYVFYNSPGNVKEAYDDNYKIRVPSPDSLHPGTIYSAGRNSTSSADDLKKDLVKTIDTTGFTGKTGQTDITFNAKGEPYNNMDTLRDAVRWRLGTGLVEPGKEARSIDKPTREFIPAPAKPDPNQMQFIDQLLAEQSKPQAIVGGNPQNYFSTNQLSQRQNLNAPSDFSGVDPYLMGSPANMNKGTMSPDVESHINALRQMLFYGKSPNGQEE